MAILGAFLLRRIFSKMGLFLWDLKWEIARDADKLVFVDTIDTDSVRVTYNMTQDNKSYFVHFNKQAMRDYYKIMHAEWYNAVNESKKIATQSGRPFTEILSEGQKKNEYPGTPVIDEQFLDLQKRKFEMVRNFIKNQKNGPEEEAAKIARAEIDYYRSVKKIEEYGELNGG